MAKLSEKLSREKPWAWLRVSRKKYESMRSCAADPQKAPNPGESTGGLLIKNQCKTGVQKGYTIAELQRDIDSRRSGF